MTGFPPARRIPRWIGWPLLAVWTYFVLNFLARMATFHPAKYPEGLWDLQHELRAEDVWLDSNGVRIHAWMIPALGERSLVTLYLHGNAGNLTHRVDHLLAIRQAGSAILIIDYRGYGKSEGSPDEQGIYSDADAAYQHLTRQGWQPRQIIIHGESLGTAVAADLASRQASAGVILEAPFPSARAVAARVLPLLGPLLVSGLATAEKMGRVTAPVLIIHGDRDEVIAHDLGRRVFAAAREPKEFWTVPGAGHNDILHVAGAEYVERLREFYRRLR